MDHNNHNNHNNYVINLNILSEIGNKCFDISEFTKDYPLFLTKNCIIYAIDEHKNKFIFDINLKYNIRIIGFGAIFKNKEKCHLMTFFIDPSFQNLSYGYDFLKYICKFYKKVTLHVRVSNEKALKLYQKCNFKILYVEHGYYNKTYKNEDAFFMIYERKVINF